jgi:hypothetical protein
MLKQVQHDSKKGISRSCHPEPGPELINQSIIVYTPRIKSLLPSPAYRQAGFTKGRNSPLWYPFPVFRQAKRGQGRFSEEHVFSIMGSLVIQDLRFRDLASGLKSFRFKSPRVGGSLFIKV